MKKLFLLFACACFATTYVSAQDCMAFFPSNEGATLINKTYNADSTLVNTMTYRVNKSYDYMDGTDMTIGFTMSDSLNNVIDNGNIEASCSDGNFYLKMVNRAMSPEVMEMLGKDTELVGNFLDYPDTFNEIDPFDGDFATDAGEYTLQSKTDKKNRMTVRVYNREFEKNEKITTPAGTFDAAKITFGFDCIKDGKTQSHKGVEWYAPGAGIVRSETYDKNNNLENYTVLTTLQDK